MARIRIQPKPEPLDRPALARKSLPIATALALGVLATLAGQAGHPTADELAAVTGPCRDVAQLAGEAGQAAWQALTAATTRAQLVAAPIEANGRAWVAADHPEVVDFAPAEMVPVGQAAGWELFANRARGLPGLSDHPAPYDRLYVRSAPETYAPLRWRDVPR